MYGIKSLVDKAFDKEKIDKIVTENISSWERFFRTKKTFIKINSALMDETKVFFEGSSKKIIEVLEDKLRGYIGVTILDTITDELQSQFKSKSLEIEQYQEDREEKKSYEHKERKEALEKELNYISKNK